MGKIRISNSNISNNGGSGLFVQNSNVEIINSTIENNEGYGIKSNNCVMEIDGAKIEGNKLGGISAIDDIFQSEEFEKLSSLFPSEERKEALKQCISSCIFQKENSLFQKIINISGLTANCVNILPFAYNFVVWLKNSINI